MKSDSLTLTRTLIAKTLLPLAMMCTVASAQMHKTQRPESVTRAVSVYEYVGDMQHPRAARLIPVSLFIDGRFEDAGVYLARPIPLALDTGNRYELDRAGVRLGYLDVKFARDTERTAGAVAAADYDDGWFGYGTFAPLHVASGGKLRPNCGNAHVVTETDSNAAKPSKGSSAQKPAALPPPKTAPCVETSEDDRPEKIDLPDDTRRSDAPDPERPTLHRSPEGNSHNSGTNGKPDKKQKIPAAVVTAPAGGPDSDPDRPTIHHRTATDDADTVPPDPDDLARGSQADAAHSVRSGAGAVSGSLAQQAETHTDDATITGAISPESDRPVLQRGNHPQTPLPPASTLVAPAPKPELPEVIAVSDPVDRPAHDFSHAFASPTERATALAGLQALAQAVIADPALATDAPDALKHSEKQADMPSPPAFATRTHAAHPGRKSVAGKRAEAAKAAGTTAGRSLLTDEVLQAYELFYGAPVTYVYTAMQAGKNGAPDQYVVVVAQTDPEGKLQPALRSVTDAAHVDRIPRYRFVDAVDADASHRAELLFELRGARSRQFALYRLLGNHPDQTFITGTMRL